MKKLFLKGTLIIVLFPFFAHSCVRPDNAGIETLTDSLQSTLQIINATYNNLPLLQRRPKFAGPLTVNISEPAPEQASSQPSPVTREALKKDWLKYIELVKNPSTIDERFTSRPNYKVIREALTFNDKDIIEALKAVCKEPYLQAVLDDRIDVIEELHAQGFDIDTQNSDSVTALFVAVADDKIDIVRALLKLKANPNLGIADNFFPLHWAACRGKLEMMRLLLLNGAHVNAQMRGTLATPLHFAARHNQYEAVKLLCEFYANTFLRSEGSTPYMIASQKRFIAISEFLKRFITG